MHVFPIRSYPWRTLFTVTGIAVGLPLIVVALTLWFADALPNWLFILSLAITLGFLLSLNIALIVLALFVATRNEITIRTGTMHLKGGEFHERVPLDCVTAARVIDLAGQPALAGAAKRNGITLPGFRVGWYQTSDGRWLFVLRAVQTQLLHVQTNMRFDVLLGVQAPAELAGRLLANGPDDRD